MSQRAVVQMLMAPVCWQIMCQSEGTVMERQQLTARTSPCPATAVCPCQNKPSALPCSNPCPSRAACTSLLCILLLACSLHPHILPAVLLAAATGVGVQQELSERATGNFGKDKGQRSCEQGKHSRSTDCWVHSQIFHLHTSSVLA